MAKPLKSANVSTDNVLFKVTVPKRTGLKRKRGADGVCHEVAQVGVLGERAASLIQEAQYLFRSMCDNPKSYRVEAIGTVNQTHRFRGARIVFPKAEYLSADTIRHAGLCHLDCEYAAFTEVSRAHIAVQM